MTHNKTITKKVKSATKIEGQGDYWAVICGPENIMGVFASKTEAKVMLNDVELGQCVVRHRIRRCNVIISYNESTIGRWHTQYHERGRPRLTK